MVTNTLSPTSRQAIPHPEKVLKCHNPARYALPTDLQVNIFRMLNIKHFTWYHTRIFYKRKLNTYSCKVSLCGDACLHLPWITHNSRSSSFTYCSDTRFYCTCILRQITDAPRYVNNQTIHTDLNIPYITDVIKEKSTTHHNKLARHSTTHYSHWLNPSTIADFEKPGQLTWRKTKRALPLGKRLYHDI
jgi:hypothetical protein